jgi:hypothetical protein
MSTRPILLSLCILIPLPLAHCTCGEEELDRVAPKIEISDKNDPGFSICATDNIRDCTFDFGEVPIGEGRFLKFLITNPSPVELQIRSLYLSDDSDPSLEISSEMPEIVPPDKETADFVEVVVRFAPSVESPVTGTLVIESDAVNLNEDEDLIVTITGSGIDIGRPEILVTPDSCAFGEVGVGVTGFCDLSIENIGARDLQVNDLSFSAETPIYTEDGSGAVATFGYGTETIFPIPTFVAPGTATSLRLLVVPEGPQEYTGALLIDSNDPERPQVSVPLSVTGAQAPTAVAEIESINGTPNSDSAPQIKPLDDVVLTGVNSVAANVGGTIVAWEWTITEMPMESSVTLDSPNSMTTGFTFSSGAGDYHGLDVAGTFVISLQVTDDNGLVSSNDARVTINAIPQDALHVQLSWDSGSYDIDLHLIRAAGPYCSADSCYYGNCKTTSLNRAEWDGVAGVTGGDPTLDIDDLSGYGPENINVDFPLDGTYTVGVHAYSFTLSEPTWATLKIFVNGALAYEDARELVAGRDFWEVSEVQWSNGAAIVFPVNTYSSSWSCPIGF